MPKVQGAGGEIINFHLDLGHPDCANERKKKKKTGPDEPPQVNPPHLHTRTFTVSCIVIMPLLEAKNNEFILIFQICHIIVWAIIIYTRGNSQNLATIYRGKSKRFFKNPALFW